MQGYYIDYYWTTRSDVPSPYDKATLTNHDWVIARRGFFFDLSPWADAAPDDDPHQPLGSDRAAFQYMLAAAYEQVIWGREGPPSTRVSAPPPAARASFADPARRDAAAHWNPRLYALGLQVRRPRRAAPGRRDGVGDVAACVVV